VLDPIVQREFEKLSDDYGPVGDNTLGAKVYQDFALTDDAVIFFIGQGMWLPKLRGLSKSRCPAPNSHRCWPSCRRRLRR
jgi:hypothetical protein